MPTRTFIAVAASPEIRQGALRLIETLRPAAGDVKWVEAENLHWTLQFLGNIDERNIPEVCEAVAKAAEEMEAFEVETRGAGAFPSADRPRTLWIGAGQGERSMSVLHAAVERRLKSAAIAAKSDALFHTSRSAVPGAKVGRTHSQPSSPRWPITTSAPCSSTKSLCTPANWAAMAPNTASSPTHRFHDDFRCSRLWAAGGMQPSLPTVRFAICCRGP